MGNLRYRIGLPSHVNKLYFKVMLTTGRCGSPSQCPNGVLPYGLPGYGFRASYETQGADGGRIRSSGVFVTSSCCGALQLPFTTFGFGDFATYVENVPVSVPAPAPVRSDISNKGFHLFKIRISSPGYSLYEKGWLTRTTFKSLEFIIRHLTFAAHYRFHKSHSVYLKCKSDALHHLALVCYETVCI